MADSNQSIVPNTNPGDPPQFNRLANDVFEEMCCAILAKEPGVISADLFGRPREKQFGIDAIGEIVSNGGIIVMSCKCYTTIKRGQLTGWSNEFMNHWETFWQKRQIRRFILAIASDVKSSERRKEIEKEKARFADIGISYEVWQPRLLQEKLRGHPGLVSQFLGKEWVSRLCGISGVSFTNPSKLLEERCMLSLACEFEAAADYAEKAAQLARDLNDKKTLINALRCAARDLGDFLLSRQIDDSETRQVIIRISSHITELETLDIPSTLLALEKALFARLEKKSSDVLKFAKTAEMNTDNPEIAAEALLIQLQAYWQMKTPEIGLTLSERIRVVTKKTENSDVALVLQGSWLRTLCKTSKSTNKEIQNFIALARNTIMDDKISPNRFLMLINEVASEFGRAENHSGARSLLGLALEVASKMENSAQICAIAIEIANIETEIGNEKEVNKHLGIAEKWIDILKAKEDTSEWVIRKVLTLASRGRIESRFANKHCQLDYRKSLEYHRAAYEALNEAIRFIKTHEAKLAGDIGAFQADLNLKLGKTALSLGRPLKAVDHFHKARTDQIMGDERFQEFGTTSMIGEVEALMQSGRPYEARSLLIEILDLPYATETLQNNVKNDIAWIDEHIVSVNDWQKSKAAEDIRKFVASKPEGLRCNISIQTRPLIEWFKEFSPKEGEDHVYSALFDIWGRGGFSRIVAAVQADPLNTISVDATCIAEIELWARVFCPLYDTVIVNWKGSLDDGLAVVPMPDNLGPPGEFGGQGYTRTSDTYAEKDGWHAAVGWGNFLPKDVAEFLATEALPLIQSGRLILIPAPLVGCTQSAIGWTDNLFVDTFLGGVVKTAGFRQKNESAVSKYSEFRQLDLGNITIPYIDNVTLSDLDRILADTGEWLIPLRHLLQGALGSSNLRFEQWDSLRPYFIDIRDAFRQLGEKWKSLMPSGPKGEGLRVTNLMGTFSAVSRGKDTPGVDNMTNLLRSIAGSSPDLGPWIPFWCLQGVGGQINWTRPLDNRSIPPHELARFQGFRSSVSQGWLYPGDGGPGMGAAIRPDK